MVNVNNMVFINNGYQIAKIGLSWQRANGDGKNSQKNAESVVRLKKTHYLCNFATEFLIRGVAQLVSAPRSGRGGRKFESSHPDTSDGLRGSSLFCINARYEE